MKIFEFDPVTGKKGAFIENRPCMQYGAESIKFMVENNRIEPIDVKIPKQPGCDWIARVDAGSSDYQGKQTSYLGDSWICFCSGKFGDVWEWNILPPRDLIVRK